MELFEGVPLNVNQSSRNMLEVPKTPRKSLSLSSPIKPTVSLTPQRSPSVSPLKRCSPHLCLPGTPQSKRGRLTPSSDSNQAIYIDDHEKEILLKVYPPSRAGIRKRSEVTLLPLPPIRVDLVTTSIGNTEPLNCSINGLINNDLSNEDRTCFISGINQNIISVPVKDSVDNPEFNHSTEFKEKSSFRTKGFNSYHPVNHIQLNKSQFLSQNIPKIAPPISPAPHTLYLPPRSRALLNRSTILLLETYQNIAKIYKRKIDEENRTRSKKAIFYPIREGDILNSRYKMVGFLGKGSFGQVVKAQVLNDNKEPTDQMVAIKILRKSSAFLNQGNREVQIIKKINENPDNGINFIVKFIEEFMHEGHLCIVFELLSHSLLDLVNLTLKSEPLKPGLSLRMVHKLTHQLICALATLGNMQIIHCDLKPENVALTSPNRAHIKVLDFGSSCHLCENNGTIYPYIQSRYYRAPEVLLGCKFGLPIDMWSLGCIVVELYTAKPLFVGQDGVEQLYAIIDVLGDPPSQMLTEATHLKKFFIQQDGNLIHKRKYKPKPRKLEDIISSKPDHPEHLEYFLDLVKRMLTYEPDKRIKPHEALQHPFILYGPNNNIKNRFSQELLRKLSPLCKTAN